MPPPYNRPFFWWETCCRSNWFRPIGAVTSSSQVDERSSSWHCPRGRSPVSPLGLYCCLPLTGVGLLVGRARMKVLVFCPPGWKRQGYLSTSPRVALRRAQVGRRIAVVCWWKFWVSAWPLLTFLHFSSLLPVGDASLGFSSGLHQDCRTGASLSPRRSEGSHSLPGLLGSWSEAGDGNGVSLGSPFSLCWQKCASVYSVSSVVWLE